MKVNKTATIALSAIAIVSLIGSVIYYGGTQVLAVATKGNTLITNLATKFGVSESEVQAVFDETRVQAESDRLDQAVTDGKITADQKALIIAKQTEMQTKIEEINNQQLTQAERRTQLDALMEAQKTWLETNNIPLGIMRGGMKGPGGMNKGFGEGRDMMDNNF